MFGIFVEFNYNKTSVNSCKY